MHRVLVNLPLNLTILLGNEQTCGEAIRTSGILPYLAMSPCKSEVG